MKKILFYLILSLVAFGSLAVNRTKSPDGIVLTGQKILSTPMRFAVATDYLSQDDTFYINVTARQLYTQIDEVLISLDSISGAPSIAWQLQGRLSTSAAWSNIGSSATWNEEADNPLSLTYTTANTLRYFRLMGIASSTTQHSHITAFEFFSTLTNGSNITTGLVVGNASANETTPSIKIYSDADSDTGGDTDDVFTIDITPNATPTSAVWDVTSTQSAGYRFDKSLRVGLATPDETTPSLIVTGDADSDAADVTEALTVVLTPNATPTSATWGFTSTQGAGYTFDKKINSAAGVDLGTSQALTGTTGLTIGAGTETVAINSSDWDISATGVMSGIGAIVTDGTFDNVVINSAAGGDKGINESITQVAGTALTGNLIGAGIVATNGTTTAPTGVIYGIEAKARAANSAGEGGAVTGRLTGVYASVDVKAKEGTTIRAFEASLDGAAGGTSTEAVAFEAFNNSSATQTSSYAFSANGGTSAGHKAYTADVRLSSGAFIFTGSAANGNAVYSEVGAKDATGSIYISTAGALYVQVANAGAESDWYKVTATNAD